MRRHGLMVLALLLVTAGCAGRDFVRPPAGAFIAGKTTEAEVRRRVTPSRAQGFYFWKDVLVGHEFVSSFPEDTTDFDVAKVSRIRRGDSEAAVATLLGAPHGAYLYPLVADRTDRGLVYLYSQTRGTAFNLKLYQQQLVVTVGADGVVKDVQLTTSGER